MKKLFLACGFAMSLALASCGGSADKSNSFDDSLSVVLGQFNGASLNANFLGIPEEERAHFQKEDVIRGMKEVFLADTAKYGYYTGLSIGLQMNQQLIEMEKAGIHINRSLLLAELSRMFMADTVTNMEALQEEYSKLTMEAQTRMMAAREAEREAARAAEEQAAAENIQKGADFMANLKNDPDVKFTESGLAYKVEKQGEGATAKANDQVELTYVGTLIDGTEFDKSERPITFTPEQTVPGFSEGLQLMNPGSKYTLYIPSNLGYGNRQAGRIPANSVLVFQVEVLGVTPAAN